MYCWCNNNLDENGQQTWSFARKFIGEKNRSWGGTPLSILYDHYHYVLGKSEEYAINQAGKDAGMLLKDILRRDSRTFESRQGYKTREYRWVRS